MISANKSGQLIAETCHLKGIRKVVFSPGSRSAPLVIAFSQIADIECIVVPDERSAGYYALGIAQQLQETVAVVCTSGTATLNLLPACCEAYYQEVPLLFLTADRPEGAVMEGENQSIYQVGLFGNFAFDMELEADKEPAAEIVRKVEKAIFKGHENNFPSRLNIHFKEPLYEIAESASTKLPKNIFKPEAVGNSTKLRIASQQLMAEELAKSSCKLIIVGLHRPDKNFTDQIKTLAMRKDVVVLAESVSNCSSVGAILDYDSCLAAFENTEDVRFFPDIVITLGNQIISKRIRQFLRTFQPAYHWDIASSGEIRGRNYFHLSPTPSPIMREEEALECLLEMREKENTDFKTSWHNLSAKVEQQKSDYLQEAPYSDFTVLQKLVSSFPQGSHIQYGNSTPVRYSNFFPHDISLTVNANRGTSGIDGCVSTAAGAAHVTKEMTICVVGDVSFLYDSNALWNNHLSPNFRIIIINNSGGNIFRLMDGPAEMPDFEKFFETKHTLTAKHLATMFDIPYYFCDQPEHLDEALADFYLPKKGRPAILEIKTNNVISAAVFKQYFKTIRPQL